MANLTGLYSSDEEQELKRLRDKYNSVLTQLEHEINVNASSKAGYNVVQGTPFINNPNVYDGKNLLPSEYKAWQKQSDEAIVRLRQQAVQDKIALDNYNNFLIEKYTLAFNAAHPELAPQLAQIAMQGAVDLANAQAQGEANLLATETEAKATLKAAESEALAKEKAAKNQKIIIYVVLGVSVLILAYWLWKKSKNKTN